MLISAHRAAAERAAVKRSIREVHFDVAQDVSTRGVPRKRAEIGQGPHMAGNLGQYGDLTAKC